MKLRLYMVTGKHERYTLALAAVEQIGGDLMDQGYIPSGNMVHFTVKEATDSFTCHVFIQPMVYLGEDER